MSGTIYCVRRIKFLGKFISIVLQSHNGPCPLIGVVNVLLLSNRISLHPQQDIVTFDELSSILQTYLQTKIQEHAVHTTGSPNSESVFANELQAYEEVLKVLPKLEHGLDVNVRFTSVSSFEFTPEMSFFELFDIRVLHGWVVDPEERKACAALDDLTYNQCLNKVLASTEDEQELEEQSIIRQWLNENSAQFTVFGLSQLHDTLRDREVCVFFRNNHFSTMLKLGGRILTLCTDQGIVDAHPAVVWQIVSYIDGDDCFLTSTFEDVNKAKRMIDGYSYEDDRSQWQQQHPQHRRRRKKSGSCTVL